MADDDAMHFARRFDRWTDRGVVDRSPLGAVACGRGLRRTGLTRRDLAREYDDWIDRSFQRTHDAGERDPP